MKMKLNVVQRIEIYKHLPTKGSILTLKTVESLRSKVAFSDDEIKEFELEEYEEGGLLKSKWNDKGREPIEIEFKDSDIKFLKGLFEKLSENKPDDFNFIMLSIYEQIESLISE